MKKLLLLVLALTFITVSCKKEEKVENSDATWQKPPKRYDQKSGRMHSSRTTTV